MFPPELAAAATVLLDRCRDQNLRLATAESCTGGLIAALLTEAAGASDVFERGLVTYSNAAKEELLGVPAALLETQGAVSAETARAMAEGTLVRVPVELALAVTGIAGPGGGSDAKPVGLVHFAAARRGRPTLHHEARFGALPRGEIRRRSVATALALALQLLPQ